jgi:hypothetical protein
MGEYMENQADDQIEGGIELADEAFIKTELKKYNITDVYISAMSDKAITLKVKNVNDKGGYKIVHEARIQVKNKRVEIEKKRKWLKRKSLRFSKAVDFEAKRIFGLLLPIEEHLISQEKIVDDEKERIKTQKETEERERIEQEEADRKKEEEEHQEKIREEQRIESERLEKIRIEQEEKEAKIKIAQDKVDAEKRIIAEQKEKEDREIRIRNEEKEMAERAKVEADQLAKRKEEEKLRVEEQAKKDEKLRLALLPDIEKLIAFARAFRAIPLPSLSTNKCHNILSNAIIHLKKAYEILTKER